MPDKTLRVVSYAAGASLAAIALVYVFGPTYFLDREPSKSPGGAFSNRKRGVVGLSNPANDCFINSVLQALAGLGDLRLYLIREVHRRSLDGEFVYLQPVPPGALALDEEKAFSTRFAKDIPDWKLEGLQRGCITRSLKEILDALNERPIYKKTISAAPFVRALEDAFRQRISRQQQDAQEFLQVVAERLCDEYHAGRRARLFARRAAALGNALLVAGQDATKHGGDGRLLASPDGPCQSEGAPANGEAVVVWNGAESGVGAEMEGETEEEEEGFPLEGSFESQIECLTCGFKPRPTESTFCTLTLNVPHVPATTLGACFDSMFKTEYIDDFRCEKCRLLHAVAFFESERKRSSSEAARAKAQEAIEKLRLAIDTDPEKPPGGVVLPDISLAPRRRIARHIRLTRFPKVLAIHLSRSIFDASHFSQKNSAKVSFPVELPLGGLLQQRKYKLLGVVTHKGSHHSGHYESFRRQNSYPPFSNTSTFQASGAYSRAASPMSTPRMKTPRQGSEATCTPASQQDGLAHDSEAASSPPSHEPATVPAATPRDPTGACAGDGEGTVAPECHSTVLQPQAGDGDNSGFGGPEASARPSSSAVHSGSTLAARSSGLVDDKSMSTPSLKRKQRKQEARWWRISDDKVKEASTRDVLSMQREVYLLFYELERSRF